MDSDTELAAAAAIIIATISKRKKGRRKPRTTWVKPWLQKRSQLGMYDTLVIGVKTGHFRLNHQFSDQF